MVTFVGGVSGGPPGRVAGHFRKGFSEQTHLISPSPLVIGRPSSPFPSPPGPQRMCPRPSRTRLWGSRSLLLRGIRIMGLTAPKRDYPGKAIRTRRSCPDSPWTGSTKHPWDFKYRAYPLAVDRASFSVPYIKTSSCLKSSNTVFVE